MFARYRGDANGAGEGEKVSRQAVAQVMMLPPRRCYRRRGTTVFSNRPEQQRARYGTGVAVPVSRLARRGRAVRDDECVRPHTIHTATRTVQRR